MRISSVLVIPEGLEFEHWRSTLAAVDRVHGVGEGAVELAVTPRKDLPTHGRYRTDPWGLPIAIEIRQPGPIERLALVHEVGHFLDHMRIGEPATWSSRRSHPDLRDMLRAAYASEAVAGLRAQIRGAPAADLTVLRHVLRCDEVFARGYAQYIAARSADSALRTEIELLRDGGAGNICPCLHWAADDFSPLVEAFDRLILHLGWRR